jgi:hypothetical protein
LHLDHHIRSKSVGRLSKKIPTSELQRGLSLLAEVPLSPWTKVRPLKGRVLPIEAELTELSELELDEAPVNRGIALEAKDASSITQHNASDTVIQAASFAPSSAKMPGVQVSVHNLGVVTGGKARVGRKPRPQGHPAEPDSDNYLNHDVRIELVKDDEDIAVVDGIPGLAMTSTRPSLVRGRSFSDDDPAQVQESKASRPRSGRKPRPSTAGVVRPAVAARRMSSLDDSKAGLLKPLPMHGINYVVSDKEPEWAKPKLNCTTKHYPTGNEKQATWTKPTWSINRSHDFERHHQTEDDPTEASESATEP